MNNNSTVERFVFMDTLVPLFKEGFVSGQSIRFSPSGTSMLPMLRQGIDSVVLSPLPERLSRFDLPLYQRDNGKYILHRIVEVGETYTCMGDNQFVKEHGVRQDQMIAVVTSFYRGEKEYKTTGLAYRLYCRVWYYSHPLRHFVVRAYRWLRRHLR